MKIKENWKQVIHRPEALSDAIRDLVDDYLILVEEHEANEFNDDATWVHVDVAKEEMDSLKEEYNEMLNGLEKQLGEMTVENCKLKREKKAMEKYIKQLESGDKPKKKLLKAKKPLKAKPSVWTPDDDDIPF